MDFTKSVGIDGILNFDDELKCFIVRRNGEEMNVSDVLSFLFKDFNEEDVIINFEISKRMD